MLNKTTTATLCDCLLGGIPQSVCHKLKTFDPRIPAELLDSIIPLDPAWLRVLQERHSLNAPLLEAQNTPSVASKKTRSSNFNLSQLCGQSLVGAH